MSDQTKIEWADSTFNPWIGCTKISPACDHCYAENLMDHRMHRAKWGAGKPRVRTSAENWRKPIAWNSSAWAFVQCNSCGWRGVGDKDTCLDCKACRSSNTIPARRRVFCASLADVFDNEIDPQWRVDLLHLIAKTPHLDWLLLTKRIGNAERLLDSALDIMSHGLTEWRDVPWPNVWLGATICNQEEADRDIPKLLATPAAIRFLSIEPMLGPVDLSFHLTGWCPEHDFNGGFCVQRNHVGVHHLNWVIVGGEGGPGARPMQPDWVRRLRDQCFDANVPFLTLDGLELNGVPESITQAKQEALS